MLNIIYKIAHNLVPFNFHLRNTVFALLASDKKNGLYMTREYLTVWVLLKWMKQVPVFPDFPSTDSSFIY